MNAVVCFSARFVVAATVCCSMMAGDAPAKDPAAGSAKKEGSATKGSGTKSAMADLALADGALSLKTPAAWKKVKPRNRIIEMELAVPGKPSEAAVASAAPTARLTMMAAGGGVEQNLARWVGQFQDADKEKTKTEHREVTSMPLHTIDISGTYMESMGGPFFAAKKTPRPDYRMLGAILQTKNEGTYFFKLIGPAEVVEHNAKAFAAMLDSVEVK